jgi:uncharacterized membrane protein
LWIGVIANGFYTRHLGYLFGEVKWVPAIIFYIIFIFGLTYFVTYPLHTEPMMKVFLTGALFGLIAYATYDLTNHALVRDWPAIVTVVDMAWGTLLSALVAVSAVGLFKLLS